MSSLSDFLISRKSEIFFHILTEVCNLEGDGTYLEHGRTHRSSGSTDALFILGFRQFQLRGRQAVSGEVDTGQHGLEPEADARPPAGESGAQTA